jgi:hypothetical protein
VAELLQILGELIIVLRQLLVQLLYLGLQNSLLLMWLAWALLGINWKRMWPVLKEGAWVPVVLLTIMVALVWANLVPGSFEIPGIVTIPNFWSKLAAVWLVVGVTCFLGWLQGVLNWMPPEINLEPPAPADHGHHHHH